MEVVLGVDTWFRDWTKFQDGNNFNTQWYAFDFSGMSAGQVAYLRVLNMCTNGSQPSYVECVVGKWNTNQYYARGNAARLLLKVKDMVIYYRGAGDVSYGRAWHSSSITPTTVQSVPADATDITIQ